MHCDWPPPLETHAICADQPPARLARQLLAESGGIAGICYIRDQLVALKGAPLSLRQARDLLRSRQVRRLGAGYVATQETVYEPVQDWAERIVARSGSMPTEALVAAILAHYPRGNTDTIRRWLAQEPGRLQHAGGRIRFTPQRWKTS